MSNPADASGNEGGERVDGRTATEIREMAVELDFPSAAPGSVLLASGGTVVLCTASIDEGVPPWRRPKDERDDPLGWLTAEYNMLPGSTSPRKPRDRKKVDGRTTEIQRLIGRSLRAVVDFEALGPRTVTIDCDVTSADGGTRTLAITGGFIALAQAVHSLGLPGKPIRDALSAISVGIVDGDVLLDLCYAEDSRADVDANIVLTGSGDFVEVQASAEGRPFSPEQFANLAELGRKGCESLFRIQQDVLGDAWPL